MYDLIGCLLGRLDSSRLPKKVLTDVGGKPLIVRIADKATKVYDREIVIATTDRHVDDELYDVARSYGYQCYRGSIHPLQRLKEVSSYLSCEFIARLNGDSPYISDSLVTLGMQETLRNTYDLVTNLAPRSFPYGITLQIVRTATLFEYQPLDDQELEHITPYLERISQQKCVTVRNIHISEVAVDWPEVDRYTVDEPKDLSILRLKHTNLA